MGCDIHMAVEVLGEDGWQAMFLNRDEGYLSSYGPDEIYGDRNYDLFAMLANVRNGYGFAGVDTGNGFEPIAMPKGVPEDASPLYKEWVEQWGADGHSHSYLTVAELLAYDWTQRAVKRGYVGPKEYLRFKLRGSPESWCGDTTVDKLSNAAMDARIIDQYGSLDWRALHSIKESPFSDVVTQVEWGVPYYQSAGGFLSSTMPRLWRLGAPDKVRIVFFFDN